MWDFVVVQMDGTEVRFHPSAKGKMGISGIIRPGPEDMPPPRAGKGGSDGPGTFKRMLGQTYEKHTYPRSQKSEREQAAQEWYDMETF